MDRDLPELPANFSTALQSELQPGERVLYAARPDWRAEWGKLLVILLFGLFWNSIAFGFFGASFAGLTGLAAIKSDGAPASTGLLLFGLVVSIPFVLIGLASLAAPFLAVRKADNTVHAVTDARVLNVYLGPDAGAESYPLTKINFIKRRDRNNGTGNLVIGYGVETDGDGDPRPLTMDWSGIPNAQRAEALICEHAPWVR